MDKFNKIQKNLVKSCEKAHCEGIRHKGLSGTVCEDLLIETLNEEFRKLSFHRGAVRFSSLTGGRLISKDLSSQLDIIIYKGSPIFKVKNTVIVHANQIMGIIEVKKWTYPKMLRFDSKLHKSIKNLRKLLNQHNKRKIPLFFVTYRFKDRTREKKDWFSHKKNWPSKYSYCFFGNYSVKNGRIFYPWEESCWKHFENNIYAGQFEKLVSDIRQLTE